MIKEGFVLREMPGMNLVMPTGTNVKKFKGAIMLNDTGALIFSELKSGKTIEETAKVLIYFNSSYKTLEHLIVSTKQQILTSS